MVMDILLALVFAGTIFLSMRRGFALTVVGFLRSVVALVLGLLFSGTLRDFLLSHTGLGDWITDKVETSLGAQVTAAFQETALYDALPRLLREQASALTGSLASEGASAVAMLFLNLISFLLIVAGVSLVAAILSHVFSKQYRGGFLGFIDWVLGGIMGAFSGLFYSLVFLAVITPLTALFMPSLSDSLAASMEASHLAGLLYDNNPILLFFRIFTS